jgi:hypothetical protein
MITRIFPFNLRKQVPTEKKRDTYEGVTVWGFDERDNYGGLVSRNDFPQQLLQDVYNSPVASAALELWVEFIQGAGFQDASINDEIINYQRETKFELLQKIAYDVAHLEGFCLHVSYNLKGEITEIHHQPFEQTRLGKISRNGMVSEIVTNPYFGIPYDYDNEYSKRYYTFNPDPQFVIEQIESHNELLRSGRVKHKYPGQMFYVSIEKPLARIYPQPFYWSGVNWMRCDAKIQTFHERNIKNNFLLSHILNIYGDPDEGVGKQDEDGNYRETRSERLERELNSMARGSDSAGGQWINWIMGEEEKIEPVAFPTNANDQLFQALQDLVTSQIAISCKVPPILIGIQVAGKLGTTEEIINAIKEMQSRVKAKQRFISSNLSKVFLDQKDYKIKDTNHIDVVPEWVITSDVLTLQEKRKYVNDNFNIELNDSATDTI